VANNNPALVALLLKNRADAKIPFDRTKFVRPEPPITTLGLTLLNYLSIVYKEFNHTSLRHTEAVEVPLEKAHEDNLAIKKILIEAGIVAQGKKEVETATFAYERERAQHMRKPAAFY
jgi:hypothetical protein